MLRKAVIPAAGLGTRLLPMTKEMPKEMLPIVASTKYGRICIKPMLQAIFEQLYQVGFREFAFIVGRGKRAIEDHFSPDEDFIEYLRNEDQLDLANNLQEFYEKTSNSTIVFINQPKPKGFGDAVGRSAFFTRDEPFLTHAGDDFVISSKNIHLRKAIKIFESRNADILFLVEEVEDPRRYGVVAGRQIQPNLLEVTEIVEKPKRPPSNLATIALYIMKPIVHQAIKKVRPDEKGEIQLTNAIKWMIERGYEVLGLKLRPNEKRIDIGTAESYLHALKTTIIPQ